MGLPALPGASGSTQAKPRERAATNILQIDLDGMTVDDLLELRAAVYEKLPQKSLNDLDMAQESVLQLLTLQKLQRDVADDNDVPANQRAQVGNSVTSMISNLVKMQESVYSSERFKKIEQALMQCIKNLPEDTQREFIERYEKIGATL